MEYFGIPDIGKYHHIVISNDFRQLPRCTSIYVCTWRLTFQNVPPQLSRRIIGKKLCSHLNPRAGRLPAKTAVYYKPLRSHQRNQRGYALIAFFMDLICFVTASFNFVKSLNWVFFFSWIASGLRDKKVNKKALVEVLVESHGRYGNSLTVISLYLRVVVLCK